MNACGEMLKPPFPGPDKHLGYSAFAFIPFLLPEFVIYNGDLVYYDSASADHTVASDIAVSSAYSLATIMVPFA